MSTQPIPQPDQFQYVKLPDGSYGKFASDATDDQIKQAISKDFPSAFPAPDARSATQRFLDSAGIPRTMGTLDDVKQAFKNLIAPEASPTSPGFGQTLPIVGPMFRAQRETFDQPGVAGKLYGSIPILGPIGYRMAQQLNSGDNSSAAGSGVNMLIQALAMKGTNAPANISTALDSAGTGMQAAAPALGKTAGAAVTGAGILKAVERGNPEYLLSALAHNAARSTVEGVTAGAGSGLQALARALKANVPDAFEGSPLFTSQMPEGPTPQPQTPQGPAPFTPSPNAPYLLRQRLRELSKKTDYTPSQAANIQQVRAGFDNPPGGSPAAEEAAQARMAQYAKSPWENEQYIKQPEQVGTQAGAANDTALFQKARQQLGPQASISEVAQLAQKMKVAQIPKIGPFPAMDTTPQVVNNGTDLSDLLTRSIQAARAKK